MRDEAISHVNVAIEAKRLVLNMTNWFDEPITSESKILVGDKIEVMCSFVDDTEKVNPTPQLKLLMIGRGENGVKGELVLAENRFHSQHGNMIKATKQMARSDANSQFLCECIQKVGNEKLFLNSISSVPLTVFQPPTLAKTSVLPEYYVINASAHDTELPLIIPVKFYSIPQPKDEDVYWRVYTDSTSNVGEKNVSILYPGMNTPTDKAGLMTYPIERAEPNLYEATIEVKNISANMSIILQITNAHGDLSQQLPELLYYPKIGAAKQRQGIIAKSGLSLWVMVVIVSMLVLFIFVIGAILICTRRRKKVQRQNRRENNGHATQVDLDHVPEEKVQYLQDTLLPPSTNKFHRSESDRNENVDCTDAAKQQMSNNGDIPQKQMVAKLQQPITMNANDTHVLKGIKRYDEDHDGRNNLEYDDEFFNEELLNVQNNQPDFYAGLRELEPKLGEQHMSAFRDEMDENDTVIRTPDGAILRLSGPTNYPVMSRPPPNFTFERTPSRKTSQIQFMGAKGTF